MVWEKNFIVDMREKTATGIRKSQEKRENASSRLDMTQAICKKREKSRDRGQREHSENSKSGNRA